MSRVTHAALRVALAVAPADARKRLAEEWSADLESAGEHGMRPSRYALGLVAAALRLRVARFRHPRRAAVLAILASAALVTGAIAAPTLAAPRRACDQPAQVLGVIAGTTAYSVSDPILLRERAATRIVRQSGGFEGLWYEQKTGIVIGVYGPAWPQARAAASALSTVPGRRITFVCEPATERELVAAQQALSRSAFWKSGVIGYSDIDVKTATVTVGIVNTAMPSVEADLMHQYGPRIRIRRVKPPMVDFQAAVGRMPARSGAGT